MSEAAAAPSAPADLRTAASSPGRHLSVADGVSIIVGIVVGSAIFETPGLVAANAGSPSAVLLFWLAGGGISVLGALCWAELGAAYPHAGGDYHYLKRAWGGGTSFLYAWGRMTVIQTGSVALIAFVFGDYASQLLRIGPHSSAIWAAIAAGLLTILQLAGLNLSRAGQRWLSAAQVAGLLMLIVIGLFLSPSIPAAPHSGEARAGSIGLALVFVLLTYGGWNEASFVSAELRDRRHDILRVMLFSIALITALYLAVNAVMLQRMGMEAMIGSDAVGADLMRIAAGERGAVFLSVLVMTCALASINAMLFTGARCGWALGRDFRLLSALGQWEPRRRAPANALLLQTLIVFALIAFGAASRDGFEAMVDYTAPVFWLFFLLTTLSLMRLRKIDRARERPWRVPLYPFTPIFFAGVCAWLLYSSVVYTGSGALVGLTVVAAGIPVWLMANRSARNAGSRRHTS